MKRSSLHIVSAALITSVLILAACAPRPALTTGANQTPVIIDTDMSADAVMAILYVLNRSEFSVQAITVAGNGNSHCGPAVEHALGIITLARAGDIPVACGRETPLAGNNAFPEEWRAVMDGTMGIDWPDTGRNPAGSRGAVELLKDALDASAQPVVLLTDGPLTNVAELFQAYPELMKKVQMIYSMGGAIDVPGNTRLASLAIPNETAEFNIYADPRAANLVFQSGAPVTLVPLDATNQVPLDLTFYKLMEAHQDTPSAKAVYDMLTELKIYGGNEFLWDPLTYALPTDESLATYETRKLIVVEETGPESGRTKVSDEGSPVRVAQTVDAERFIENYLSTINGGQAVKIDWEAERAKAARGVNVTMNEGECTFEGPHEFPAGPITIHVSNENAQKLAYVPVFTVDDGKTMADLEAWPDVQPPDWAHLSEFEVDLDPGQEGQTTAELADTPLYLVCIEGMPLKRTGLFGPITAEK